jgi:sulfate transport system permease protein
MPTAVQAARAPAPAPSTIDEIGAGAARPPRRRRAAGGLPLRGASGVGLGVVVLWLSLVIAIPLAAVLGKAFGTGFGAFTHAVTRPETAAALRLTIGLAASVAVINAVMGALVAWVLVRRRFPGAGLFEMVIDIPFALPTIVAGLVMLTLYNADSPVGITLVGTRAGLLVTLLFVTLPFTVRTVQPVLLAIERDVEEAAASLGAGPVATFRRVILPQILPAIVSGAVLSFARALGEYGSLVLISSNLPFQTEIASSVIYGKLQDADNAARSTQQAAAIAAILLAASAVVLIVADVLQRRELRRG